ncbi:MAG: tetratricopeptide repeat protein [Blastocatellia bacterium]|nr:tetratricopeptide repeat protein [Blastocatellia bacterium]MCS7157819.1 tetratricopeptide repeat protein [Blastocatellia bacterium]MCX7753332.1 tetratricopeptide repeat protein [Blastocatellia bacterium]MDW8168105.1 tetratricopeptide repeat protein [Acidobacteriota bacterium]MDW8257647.1 tetratricopeptide repeat protein [Acidobacteriota bacterium]
MKLQSIYFGIIGLLVGFIAGFFYANHYNRANAPSPSSTAMGELPPGHPPIGVNEAEITQSVQRADAQPQNFDAQVTAATVLYRAGRLEQALKYFERANALRPDDYNTLVQLGNVHFDLGDHYLQHQDTAQSNAHFQEASRWYERALAHKPNDVNVRTDYGLTFYKRQPRDLDRAIAEYRRALAADPKHPQALHNLIVALTEKGELDEAEATLKRLEEIAPGAHILETLRQEIANRRNRRGA